MTPSWVGSVGRGGGGGKRITIGMRLLPPEGWSGMLVSCSLFPALDRFFLYMVTTLGYASTFVCSG